MPLFGFAHAILFPSLDVFEAKSELDPDQEEYRRDNHTYPRVFTMILH
jgi:hypothetical protein